MQLGFRRATAVTLPQIFGVSTLSLPRFLFSTLALVSQRHPEPNANVNFDFTKPLSKPELKTLVLSFCRHGKFYNLIQNVVASPSVLLTACHNLKAPNRYNNVSCSEESLSVVSVSTQFFCIQELANQLSGNQFDLESCCFTLSAPTHKGNSLVLPNLKLKVVVEAIRLVLEIVYDDRFVTFSYGGRVGMGRHTAIRYLKNSVVNPTWWFTVSFYRQKFDVCHVHKLCSIIEEKIKDNVLTDLIKRLFESQAVMIELGGCDLGRGFPQECGLSSILINVFLNGFDKEIQELRLKVNNENPKFETTELVSTSSSIFYKPLKIYAVRYLDEILVITSGSKPLTLDLKSRFVKYLEKNLVLQVDRVRTAIHSAVSEKIDFLGMELQVVPPSVLHPPMSDKAIRARKKYLRQKEVRSSELNNARETNRKKLGLKVFRHVFKKLKSSSCASFKFDFHIENEVQEIFRNWADDVVQEFLKSADEQWEWHRMLSAGDFLTLKRIRDQLPQELVDAYDEFQDQVDKHLNPKRAKMVQEEEEKRIEAESEQKYAESTVEDLTKLCIKVDAPIELVRKAVKLAGFTNHMGRPRPISFLMALEDSDIIKWYAGVARRWLDFFCCSRNFKTVKTVVTYHLRFSCILTLAEKHESTKREAIRHYTKDLKVSDVNGTEEVHFPTEREIKMMGDNYLTDPKPVDGALTVALIRMASDEPSYRCVAHFCERTDTIIYRIRLLHGLLKVNPSDERQWVSGMGTIHESLNQKCVPLCSHHICEFYLGNLSFQDIECTSVVDVD